MADSEKSVRARLVGHTGVSNKVGKRVYYSRLPANPKYPAISLQEISAVPEPVMGDDTGHVLASIQVDAWAEDRDTAKSLGEQVRDALQRYRGTSESSVLEFISMNSRGVRFEPEGRNWRHSQDFDFWFTESV